MAKGKSGKQVNDDEASAKKSPASKTFVWGILILAFVGLSGYGVANFGGGVTTLGSVGERPIDARRFIGEMQNQLRAVQRSTGLSLTAEQMRQFELDGFVMRDMVAKLAIENETLRVGVSVDDAEVADLLRQRPDLQGVDNKFNRDTYQAVLKELGMTSADFEEGLRIDSAQILLQSVIQGKVTFPGVHSETVAAYFGETRGFSYARITASDLASPVAEPDEAALKAYYEANPAPYTAPEKRRIDYVILKPEDLIDTIPRNDPDLKVMYDQRIDDYVMPERRLVERLIFADRASADAALAAINDKSKTFDDLVTERGLTLDDVDLGEQRVEDLGAAGEAIFALTEPGVVGPVDIDLGSALYRMNAILAASEITFEQAAPDLHAEYATDRARREIAGKIDALRDLLAEGAQFDEVAKSASMTRGQIDYFDGSSEGPAAYQAFAEAAKAASVDAYPDIMDLEDGGIFALQLLEIIPPTLKPFDEVKDQVREDWLKDATAKAVAARGEEVLALMKAGKRTSADLGVQMISEEPVPRGHFFEDLPAELLAAVFKLNVDETASVPGTATTGSTSEPAAFVFVLEKVLPADPADEELAQETAQYTEQLNDQLSNDLLGAWRRAILDATPVSIDQRTVDALVASIN